MATTTAAVTFSTIYSTIVVNANAYYATSTAIASPLYSVIDSRTSTFATGIISQASAATSSVNGRTASGQSYPIVPLTTQFTPPAACLESAHRLSSYFEVAPTVIADCYPGVRGQLTFSPGICPSGYTVGLQNVVQYQASSQDAVVARVTEFRCCPR